MLDCLMVGLGGMIGSVCRYLIGLLPIELSGGFPVKTLAINVIGSFFIGVIAMLVSRDEGFSPHLALLLRVGVCGGFTTFSTFAYESAELIKSGHMGTALGYVLLSMTLGVLAVFGAQMLVKP